MVTIRAAAWEGSGPDNQCFGLGGVAQVGKCPIIDEYRGLPEHSLVTMAGRLDVERGAGMRGSDRMTVGWRGAIGRLVVAAVLATGLVGLWSSAASAAPSDDFVITIKTDNPGTSGDTEFTIPTYSLYLYDYTVDWGDSTTDTAVTEDITHTYSAPGTYTIRISGLFPAIRFNDEGDKDKILSVDQWGTNGWRSFSGAFRGASNLTLTATDTPDMSSVFSMASAFHNAPLVNSNLDGWDVANVVSFSSTFEGASAFDVDISGWDVSSATNMRSMFRSSGFNQDISGWDVANVTSMSSMFFGNTVFDQPIGAWGTKTSKVTTFSNMFFGASSFNQPIGAWDTGAATSMQSMFRAASLFDQDLSSWNTGNVTAMGLMFMQSSFNHDVSAWDVTNVGDMSFMFRETPFDQPLAAWGAKTSNVNTFSGMFQDAPFNQDISGWDTGSATNMNGTFRSAVNFDQDLSGWDFSQVTDLGLFLDGTAMSDTRYDALLNSLGGQSLQSNVTFGALGLKYCYGDPARTNIITTYSWTFEGDAIECPPTDPTLAPDLQARSDTGPSDTDNDTAQNTPTFDVECTVAGAEIVLFSDNPAPGTEVGRHLCYEAGIEAVTAAPALPDGAHTISYLNENRKGQSAVSPSLAITIDASEAVFNPIQLENKNPGTDEWRLDNPGDDLAKQIKGYASATSVNLGGSIDFHVSVDTAQNYTIDVYRMGWYQGWGGRLMSTVGPLAGIPQTYTGPDATFGIIEFDWPVSHTLAVPTTWTSGVYLAKLTNAEGYQNYIPFTVRDDARPAQLMYQQSIITDQAYNNFPAINPNDPGYDPNDPTHQGKSFYDGQSLGADTIVGGPRAVKISFDRPYSRDGAGLFFSWEHDQVKWLEKMGYDMAYSTNLDTHEAGARVQDFDGFVSPGHDEYWTKEMFDAVETARDQGVGLAFFGANAVYSQVRLEPAADGDANRRVVSYRNNSLDPEPVFALKTNRFSELGRPEQTLIGVMYDGYNGDFSQNTDFVPTNLGHWIYEGTGFVAGDSVPGIIGYEYDRSNPGFPLPANLSYDVLSSSPFVDNNGDTVLANASVYQAPGGAWVFASGTLSWSWGLARDGLADARIERMTENFLTRVVMPSAPAAPDLQAGSDTGPSDSDDVTEIDTPSFDVGCSLPGNTVTLFTDNPVADTVAGTHVCAGVGTETLTVVTALPVGVHNLTVTETNTVGLESAASPTLVVTIEEPPPSAIPPGAVLALEADAGVVASATGLVTRWNDQSGSANDLTARSGNPMLGEAPSGASAVVFDGTTDRLRRTGGLTNMPSGAADRTVFVVAENREAGWGGFGWGRRANNQVFGVGTAPTGNYAIQGFGTASSFDSGVAAVGQGWAIQSATVDANELTHLVDGTVVDTQTHAFNTVSNLIVVGSEIDGAPQLDMSVAAVYVYDRVLSPLEQTQLGNYLTDKYLTVGPDVTDPVIEPGQAFSVESDAVNGDQVGTVIASDDVGVTGFQIIDGDPNGLFTIDAGGVITVADAALLNGGDEYTLTVEASDEAGNAGTATVAVSVVAPSPIPAGAVLVLEADAGITTNASGLVTRWDDQSPSGNDLTARAGDPTLGQTPSGAPAIEFDGVVDRLRRIGGISDLPLGAADRTVVVVAENREAGWGGFGWGVRGTNRTFGVGTAPTGNYAIQGWATANSFDSGVAAVGQGWAIQSVTVAADQMTHLIDGAVVDTQTHAFNTANNLIVLGAEIDSAPQLDMSVAAVYVFDRALSSTELVELETYLYNKYLDQGPDVTAPVIAPGQAFTIASDAATGDEVGVVAVTDDVGVADLQIIDGDPAAVFAIDSTGSLTIADGTALVAGDQYTLTVQASDAVPNVSTETVVVDVIAPSPIPSGVVLALEADVGVVTNAAGTVLSWADQSGLENNLTARSGNPTVGTAPSGVPVVDFDGVSDQLRKTSGGVNGIPVGSADRTVFVVVEHREAGWGGFGWGRRAQNQTFGVGTAPTGNYAVQGYGAANSFDSGVAAVGSGWAVQSATLAADQLTHHVDGVEVDSRTHTFNTASNLIVLGAEIDSNPQLDMSVGAVYVFDRALTTEERQQMLAYLSGKYLGP